MSEQPEITQLLGFDLADRMRKALRVAKMDSIEMAEYLDVSRASVSAWINGRGNPKTATLRLWAMRTGVPYEWLQKGEAPAVVPGPGCGNIMRGLYDSGYHRVGLRRRRTWGHAA